MSTESFYESEKCFRRYENYIHQALIAFPEEIRFEPEVRSAATDAARCRDAITAWRHKKWTSALDPAAYKDILKQITAWQYLAFVCVGPKEIMKIRRSEADLETQATRIKLSMQTLRRPPVRPVTKEELVQEAINQQENFQSLTIEQAVEEIDSGRHAGPYICENTPMNLLNVATAIDGRLNAVYVINKEGKIQIF